MKTFKQFLQEKGHTEDAFNALEVKEQAALYSQYISEVGKSVEAKADKTEVESLKTQLESVVSKDELKKVEDAFEDLSKEFEKSKGEKAQGKSVYETIKDAFIANKEGINKLMTTKDGVVSFEVNKASMTPSDIGSGTTRQSFGELLPGIEHKPFRMFSILDLFRRVPTTKEFIRYWEQDTVTRNAKIVVACATSTHTTKVTWIERVLQITKIRDFVNVCRDMLDDYDFVASEINQLLNESVKAKEESEILLGTGTASTDILSIETIASEFDDTNVLAPYTEAFDSPTLAELTAAMKAQIFTFGAENKWNADTILMNFNDYVKFQHAKNVNGDYLLPNFVLTNGNILNGMRVVTSPLVAANTLYVFDSTKGEIIDRQNITVEMFYENGTNAEQELVTIKAVERLQFHVKLINRDAFMKCSDVDTALTAITKPAV